MSSLIKPSEPWTMTIDEAARRDFGNAAKAELAIRHSVEGFIRTRYPVARICHEMVINAGSVRADVVAIDREAIAAFEIKAQYDNLTRLVHQVFFYALAVPLVWMVVHENHGDAADVIRYLLPHVGLIEAAGDARTFASQDDWKNGITLTVRHEAVWHRPLPSAMLEMLWSEELTLVCDRTLTKVPKRPTRPQMIRALEDLPLETLQRETSIALWQRDARWRADPPRDANGQVIDRAARAVGERPQTLFR